MDGHGPFTEREILTNLPQQIKLVSCQLDTLNASAVVAAPYYGLSDAL